ncbi:MAG: hypothetical protein HQL59_08640 [Magnetococcales bacterium]|nr:hypothetical protein [Magnetococcales bacterium]
MLRDLRHKLVELWVAFYLDPPSVIDQERVRDQQNEVERSWDVDRDRLIGIISESKQLPPGGEPPLMLLSALDEALKRLQGAEDTAWKEPSSRHKVHEMAWHLFPRPIPLGRTKHLEQPSHLRNWLRNHLIVPGFFPPCHPLPGADRTGIEFRFVPLGGNEGVTSALKELCSGQEPLRVWLGSFADGVDPCWPERGRHRCTAKDLRDPGRRRLEIVLTLEAARQAGAQVVILPELAVTPELRDETIIPWLYENGEESGFLLVVAGSFHERGEGQLPEAWSFNRTTLLSGDGREILVHDKLIPFGRDTGGRQWSAPGEESGAEAATPVAGGTGMDGKGGEVGVPPECDERRCECDELITSGRTVTLWMTPIGVISLAICRDFCEGEGWVRSLWETVSPDWLLVPSMSFQGGIKAHLAQAKHLHNNCNTRTLLANQWPIQPYPGTGEAEHGFVYPGPKGEPTSQPVEDSSKGRLKYLKLPGP